MSESRLDVVRRLNAEPGEAVDLRTLAEDESLVQAMWEGDFLPDAEWVLAEDDHTGLGGSYRGPDGFRRALGDYLSAWERYVFIPERIIEAGDCVVVLARERGRTRTAGADVESEAGTVWRFDGAKVRRVESYLSHEKALRAAGG